MSEIDEGMILFEQILENLEESYWDKDLDEIQWTNRGYINVGGVWYTFGWHIGWGIVLSTIEKTDRVPNVTELFYMRDSKTYQKLKCRW